MQADAQAADNLRLQEAPTTREEGLEAGTKKEAMHVGGGLVEGPARYSWACLPSLQQVGWKSLPVILVARAPPRQGAGWPPHMAGRRRPPPLPARHLLGGSPPAAEAAGAL